MSLKDNMDFVKDELNSEEKFLEGFVRVERIFKKYKLLIIGALVVLIGGFIAYTTISYLKEENKFKANILFEKALKDPKDVKSLNELKELNTKLYEIVLYKQAKTEGKNIEIKYTPYLKELNTYSKALKEQSVKKLNDVSMEKDFLLKEFAIFNKALILTKEGKYEEARNSLKLISKTSQVKDLVTILNHFLLTK